MLDRFWAKVERGEPEECWPWRAFCNPAGYGMFRVHGKMELAHRVAWTIAEGPIPEGLDVLHHCDNPPCTNRVHHFLGDDTANIADKVSKGRSSFPQPTKRGELHHAAKLTWEQVEAIRGSATGAPGEGRAFAAVYQVSPATISNVLSRKVWQ